MAVTTCLKCSGHSFELALFTPVGGQQKLNMVQCAGCGTPVAVFDTNVYAELIALKIRVSAIDEGLKRIATALDQLA
jgi:hypothetical protein